MAIGGRPRRVVRLDERFTRGIPALRNSRGRGFTLLRQSNPAYHELATWFGPLLHAATLAFRATEVQKLARRLMRARRIAPKIDEQKKPRGRPPLIATVQPLISDVVARQKWNPTMKALTREVNRAGKRPQPVSQETVTRALDLLYEQTLTGGSTAFATHGGRWDRLVSNLAHDRQARNLNVNWAAGRRG